ncbi:lipoyl(octanoyl) transferase LipB [Aestuariivirga litoralis]|uniref:lipoyl(octanoyl) transferase LipB n=1 Tax=Aestuariivirga litoralis TaxID=2650924 RepID=UPI001FF05A47|nr:lipoyl(octanoyl) transferase LipB [Aestuariivirga litoralis]
MSLVMLARNEIEVKISHADPVAWEASAGLTAYPDALARMESVAAGIAAGSEPERVWLLEHPALYTAGTSAKIEDLVEPNRFPVFDAGRGGQYTYHGPGQRVAYVMLNLAKRGGDVRAFVAALENWIMATLAEFGVQGERREDRVGIWVRHDGGEDKIAALGIRVRRGVTFHGISLNVSPDLNHFSGIVPCGVSEHGVTSLAALGVNVTLADVDAALRRTFVPIFGPISQQ